MKQINNQAAQGELLIRRVTDLPDGLEAMDAVNDRYIIGHSETGHHHVIRADTARAYHAPGNPFVLFVVVDQEALLEHMRSFDTHETLALDAGTYQVLRQREHVAEGFRLAAD